MVFVLPPKSQVGVLMNPELDKEWAGDNRVVTSDGEVISFNPPPPKPVMPDWSEIKTIRHYFNRNYKNNFWPAWIYNHDNCEERIVRNADEAAELGICYRDRTPDEKARFGDGHVWDWKDDCPWRPTPKPKSRAYDPRRPEQGKEFIATPVSTSVENRRLLESVLPEVTAAVVAALKQGGSTAPDKVDPKQWDEFLAFQAWKKTQEAIDVVAPPANAEGGEAQETESPATVLTPMDNNQEWDLWASEAEKRGIKVDKRWGLKTLKEKVEQAA